MTGMYDDPAFFDRYAQMPRSTGGLEAAGEWPQLRRMLPPLAGKRFLDLGCGYGWHCCYAAAQGASRVLGLDQSARMIEHARGFADGGAIEYRVCSMEAYEYPEKAWDCVLSNLALHYVADLEAVYQKVYKTLCPGGTFLLNIEHPVFTAAPGQDWIYGEDGAPLYWPVDDYFSPGVRHTHFLGCEVEKQHHTLTQIVQGLLHSGFVLAALEEAQPPEEMRGLPEMKDELRRPMMLLVRAYRPCAEKSGRGE